MQPGIYEDNKNLIFPDFPQFRPNLTPLQMFSMGIFGGAYFRDIHSNVTKKDHANEWMEFPEFVNAVDRRAVNLNYIAAQGPDYTRNRYGVPAGSSLEDWEKHQWINPQDPYGWVQWYCRFYYGRRTDDDARQVKRWEHFTGPTGRFRKQLIRRVKELRTKHWDRSVSPIIRQSLLQWGYELTEADCK